MAGRTVDDDRVAHPGERRVGELEIERDGVGAAERVDIFVAGKRREAVIARRAGEMRRGYVDCEGRNIAVGDAVIGLEGEAVVAAEEEIRRVAERAVGIDRHGAMRGLRHPAEAERGAEIIARDQRTGDRLARTACAVLRDRRRGVEQERQTAVADVAGRVLVLDRDRVPAVSRSIHREHRRRRGEAAAVGLVAAVHRQIADRRIAGDPVGARHAGVMGQRDDRRCRRRGVDRHGEAAGGRSGIAGRIGDGRRDRVIAVGEGRCRIAQRPPAAMPLPTTVAPSCSVTVAPFSAVPAKVGVLTLVMLSLADLPESNPSARSGVDAGFRGQRVVRQTGHTCAAAIPRRVGVGAGRNRDARDAPIGAGRRREDRAAGQPSPGDRAQLAPLTATSPLVPSHANVAPGSSLNVKVIVALSPILSAVTSLVISSVGRVVSIVTASLSDAGPILPDVSVARAVITCSPSIKSDKGAKDHVPSVATVMPIAASPLERDGRAGFSRAGESRHGVAGDAVAVGRTRVGRQRQDRRRRIGGTPRTSGPASRRRRRIVAGSVGVAACRDRDAGNAAVDVLGGRKVAARSDPSP